MGTGPLKGTVADCLGMSPDRFANVERRASTLLTGALHALLFDSSPNQEPDLDVL